MKKISLSLLICLALLVVFPTSTRAHPADMYYHTCTVKLSPDGIFITWQIVPGPMITQSIWFDVDKDQDDLVSDAEAADWVNSILMTFSVEIDQEPLTLELGSVQWPSSVDTLFSGEEPIIINLFADWPEEIQFDALVSLHNRFNPKSSLSWFEIQAEGGLSFEIPDQNSGNLEILVGLESGNSETARLTGWESGAPSIPWVVESIGLGELAEEAVAKSQVSPAAGSGTASILEGLIKKQEGSFTFILGALLLSALLGALHALSPGHGKTIVAAYLVGSQGKAYHAVVLGGIVTLTHTGSVFLLGILTLTASRYFLATDIFPVLELISGLLIFVLGIGLLFPRLKLWFLDYQQKRKVKQVKGESGIDLPHGEKRLVIGQPIEEIGPTHSHDPSDLGSIPREPSVGSPLENIRWRNLIPLAISGGLVPCPDAIAILLVAAAINRIVFGLSLIITFSFGLAVVLIAIGLLIVQGKRLFKRLRWFNKAALIMPIISALIVLTAGAWLSVSALQNISEFPGSSPADQRSTQFRLKEADVLYTSLDEKNQTQLFIIPADGGTPTALSEGGNIWYFAVAPDHSQVVYAADNGTNGSQLWLWDSGTSRNELLMECTSAYCSEIAWSPDGQRILYSRLELDSETNPANVQSIWWLDLNTRESAPLFQDALTPGFSARWSPDGRWLSYTSINPLEIKIYQMETGESRILPNTLGYPAVWSPDSKTVILQDLVLGETGYLNKIFSYSVAEDWLTMLAYDQMYYESYPTWSPDGEWLAVVRRAWVEGIPKEGNQLWVMHPDGTEATQYTDEVKFTFGQPSWSSDSRYLVFDYRAVVDGHINPGIWVLDLKTGRISDLVAPGSRPVWLE
ncbi:MAG: PD40 domain-containing protein [Anaerolineales bacterium]|nr:PD40 domain-containing protein [Anaerolineales bacterium]